MTTRLPNILDDLFPDSTPEFRSIADAWPPQVVHQILSLVWEGFDRLKALPNFEKLDFSKDYSQLERSLTGLHMEEITLLWGSNASHFESFVPKHEPWEFHGLKIRSSRPPSCDLGFVLLSNRRIRWCVEAKVIESVNSVGDYIADLRKYIDGRSSPFSMQAALGAYLLTGDSDDFLAEVAKKLGCQLNPHNEFPTRPHRYSEHNRPASKPTANLSTAFVCHHLVFCIN